MGYAIVGDAASDAEHDMGHEIGDFRLTIYGP